MGFHIDQECVPILVNQTLKNLGSLEKGINSFLYSMTLCKYNCLKKLIYSSDTNSLIQSFLEIGYLLDP